MPATIEDRVGRLEAILRNALNVEIPTPEQAEEAEKAQAELVKEAEKAEREAEKEAAEQQKELERQQKEAAKAGAPA
jgi:hypothetical protein